MAVIYKICYKLLSVTNVKSRRSISYLPEKLLCPIMKVINQDFLWNYFHCPLLRVAINTLSYISKGQTQELGKSRDRKLRLKNYVRELKHKINANDNLTSLPILLLTFLSTKCQALCLVIFASSFKYMTPEEYHGWLHQWMEGGLESTGLVYKKGSSS